MLMSCARGTSGECKIESDPFNKVMVPSTKIVVFSEQAIIPEYLKTQRGTEVLPHLNMVIINEVADQTSTNLVESTGVQVVYPDEFLVIKHQTFARLKQADELTRSWAIERLNVPVLWNLGFRGQGVRIAIFDTGILPNFPDLKSRIVWMKNFTSPDDKDWLDRNGHGTSVASIIAAEENGEFTRGVAPEAELYIAKVINEKDQLFASSLVRAIEWSLEKKVRVVNMSLGISRINLAVDQAIERAYKNGLLIIASAGNGDDLACVGSNVESPANLKKVMAVSATNDDELNSIADFTSHGPEVDLAAPGVNIGDISNVDPLTYGIGEGTSYSCPYVVGVAALILSYAPELTSEELYNCLIASTRDLGEPGKDDYYGYGFLDASVALLHLMNLR